VKLGCIRGTFSRPFNTPTAAEFPRVLHQVNSTSPVPLLDTGNSVDGWPSVEQKLGVAAHVRAKFWSVAPDGSDESVDDARIIPGLRAAGYTGWVSFEYEAPEPEATGIPRALAFLTWDRDPRLWAVRGLALLLHRGCFLRCFQLHLGHRVLPR
jgi:hypothetical protein